MKNKFFIARVIAIFVLMICTISMNVNAQTSEKIDSVFDVGVAQGVYKYSEHDNIYLPFFRFADDRIDIDKTVDGFGMSFSGKTVEVNENIEGFQILFANDSIRVNKNMEYGILFGGTNVTISSQIDKSIIVFAGEKITIAENAVIKGDIICYSNEIEVNGTVEGSVIGVANTLNLNGNIQKDLRMQVNSLDIKENLVAGEVYIESYDSSLKLPESYSNAVIKIIENEIEEKFDFSIIYTAILTAAVFTLMYFIVNKISKEKLFENCINKIKAKPIVTILAGTILLMVMPVAIITLIILSAFGLYMITVPILIVYLTFMLVVGLLSTYIVGALITDYMSKTKYLENKGKNIKYLFAFVMYLILYVLARLPYVGGYATMALILMAIGSVISGIFIKNCNKIENIEVK